MKSKNMQYADGYVLPIKKKNIEAYFKLAEKAGKIWMEHGALDYKESVGEDLNVKFGLPFTKALKTKPDETVIFSWIVFKSRKDRDRVNAKVMKDERINEDCDKEMPFDMNRMHYGGFEIRVDAK